ncbi:hypothetical protein CQW23_30918 [Capsicum baccatum]|uniref:Uncharacterized protein n=1 Tax=Capsicum baccatum TaxID=33114 RepID=A0A2G2V936_CAPBA|nr:hypothetical protein CQW23_30918 [Capsicum baccatum]
MLPSENSKELHSTDQPELEVGNVDDQKGFVSDKSWCRLISEYPENPTVEVNKTFLAVAANKDTPAAAIMCLIRLVNVVL